MDIPEAIAIPQEQYDMFMTQINAMPARKRKQWKAFLYDKWGGRSSCKFQNNQILNWSAEAQAWLKVIVYEAASDRVPVTRLDQMIAEGIPFDVAFGLEMQLNNANLGSGKVVDAYIKRN